MYIGIMEYIQYLRSQALDSLLRVLERGINYCLFGVVNADVRHYSDLNEYKLRARVGQ